MDLTPQGNLNKERLSLDSVWFIEQKLLQTLLLSGDNSEIMVKRPALEFSQACQGSEGTKMSSGIHFYNFDLSRNSRTHSQVSESTEESTGMHLTTVT
jgi:hypothetical protein